MPGQSRPLPFLLSLLDPLHQRLTLRIIYSYKNAQDISISTASQKFRRLTILEPHKITILHAAGVVSHAILRPPSKNVVHDVGLDGTLPVLLNLHGAGLEVDSHQVRHMLDDLPDLRAWVIYPSGGTLWSGDDWRRHLKKTS